MSAGDAYDVDGNLIDTPTWIELLEQKIHGEYGRVGQEDVLTPDGDLLWVSTVWLGLDHNYSRHGPPLIFETMVFRKGYGDVYMDRYPSLQSAQDGHALVVQALKEGLPIDLYSDEDVNHEE